MSKFEQELEYMPIEEVETLVNEMKQKYDLQEARSYNHDEVDELIKYMHCSNFLGMYDQGANILDHVDPSVKQLIASGEDLERSLDFYTDCCLVALRFSSDPKNSFSNLPIYREMVETLEKVPDGYSYKLALAKLQMVYHYQAWKQSGGNVDGLEQDDQDFLNTAESVFIDELGAACEDCEKREKWDRLSAMKKSLYRYYLQVGQPNDAVQEIKAVLDILPKTDNYHEADTADLCMTLGKIFKDYKKYQVAIRYFTQAQEIYSSQGEDWEPFTMQAESWIEECEKLAE